MAIVRTSRIQMSNSKSQQPEVIVVGGGFAGINVVKGLRKTPVSITLVDKHNYHLYAFGLSFSHVVACRILDT